MADNPRDKALDAVRAYIASKPKEPFIPGKTLVRYAGAVFGEEESVAFVDSFLNGWFGVGPKADEFERRFAEYHNMNHGLYVNSGSSANFLATSALKSQRFGHARLRDGDEVITSAFCFPTTISPVILNNLRIRFIDSELGSYTINPNVLKEAVTDKTKAVFLTHHLGNPAPLEEILQICDEKGLYLIEDCCDGLDSEYDGQKLGSFGLGSTFSLYPAHHITTGEGGILLSNNLDFMRAARSIRDWGRDCYCDSRCQSPNGTCGKRFTGQFGDLPKGYDHKYIYGEIGMNLKPLEFQAAFGLEQLKRLPSFVEKRKENFKALDDFFRNYEDLFILPRTVNEKSNPSWFAYPLTVKTDKFTREELVKYLEERKIQTRPFFSGNILRHPVFHGNPGMMGKYSVHGGLANSDTIAENSFFLGVYPGITPEMRGYMTETAESFLKKHR